MLPPLILLHGALGAASSMLPLSEVSNAFAEVHVLDFSGHGESDWPETSFSIETFEADVLRLMDTRNIAAAHIFGYSMGGFVGLRLAAREPDRILSITTLATKLAWTEDTCKKEAAMLDADMMEARIPKFTAMLTAAHPRNGWRTLVSHTQQMIQSMSRYRFSHEALAEIRQPARLMLGDKDRMVSIEETIETYRALPMGSLAILPDTQHPLEHADKQLLAALIRANMDKAVS
jgi:pimeloyl-ACP methyl ester carboxylesterase